MSEDEDKSSERELPNSSKNNSRSEFSDDQLKYIDSLNKGADEGEYGDSRGVQSGTNTRQNGQRPSIYDNEVSAGLNDISPYFTGDGQTIKPPRELSPHELDEAESSPFTENDNSRATNAEKMRVPIPFREERERGVRGRLKGGVGKIMQRRRNRAISAAVTGLIAAGALAGPNFGQSLGVIHFSQLVSKHFTSISTSIMEKRIGKTLRAYFSTNLYDEAGEFAGFKKKGIKGLLDLSKYDYTNKYSARLAEKGYKVEFDGERLGNSVKRVKKITHISTGEIVFDEGATFREKRAAVKTFSKQVLGEGGTIWQKWRYWREALTRYKLSYSEWSSDTKVVRAAKQKLTDALEKAAARGQKLSNKDRLKIQGQVAKDIVSNPADVKLVSTASGDADDAKDPEALDETNTTKEALETTSEEIQKSYDEAKSSIGNPDDPVPTLDDIQKTGETVGSTAFGADGKPVNPSALGAFSKYGAKIATAGGLVALGCMASAQIETAAVVARTHAYNSIRTFGSLFLAEMDAIKAGAADGTMSTAAIDGFGALLFARDTSGRSLFNSSSYRNAFVDPSVPVDSDELSYVDSNRGPIQALSSLIGSITGNLINAKSKICKVANNPLFLIFSGVAEVAAVVVSGCTVGGVVTLGASCVAAAAADTAAKLPFQIAVISAMYFLAKYVTPWVGQAFAATLCNFKEQGSRLGACAIKASKLVINTLSSVSGLTPLKVKDVGYYREQVKQDEHERIASMSIFDRYFNVTNSSSLASSVAINATSLTTAPAWSLVNLMRTPLQSIGSLGSALGLNTQLNGSMQQAYASSNPDAVYTDAFGEPEMGIDPGLLDDETYDPINNLKYLADKHLINNEFEPNVALVDLQDQPLPEAEAKGIKDRVKALEEFNNQCFLKAQITSVMYDGESQPSDTCYNYNKAPVPADLNHFQMLKYDNSLADAFKDDILSLDDSINSSTNTSVTSNVTNNRVVFLGDSLTVGMATNGNLSEVLGQSGLELGKVSATVGDTIDDGIAAVPSLEADLKTAGSIVIGLGTNPALDSDKIIFASKINQLVTAIKAINPEIAVYWVNAYTKNSSYPKVNQAIAEQSLAQNNKYTVIDWATEAKSNSGAYTFAGDGVHLTPTGYKAKSGFVAAAIKPVSQPGQSTSSGLAATTSTQTACAAGSEQINGPGAGGTFDGYDNGSKYPIRLCAVNGLPVQAINSDGFESTPGKQYYINGANGRALVNSTISRTVVAMVEAAKKDGVKLIAISSFRSMDHQTTACGVIVNNACTRSDGTTSGYARPGYSSHQLGTAIDFLDDNRDQTRLCDRPGYTENGRCISRGNAIWDWLELNAAKDFGFKQLPNESWHWSTTGN